MASFRILGLVSKNEIRSREFSFSSRYMRVKIINLVSMPELGGNFFSVSSRSLRVSVRNSRSRLDERDCIGKTLILVSRLKKRLSLTTAPYPHPVEQPRLPPRPDINLPTRTDALSPSHQRNVDHHRPSHYYRLTVFVLVIVIVLITVIVIVIIIAIIIFFVSLSLFATPLFGHGHPYNPHNHHDCHCYHDTSLHYTLLITTAP